MHRGEIVRSDRLRVPERVDRLRVDIIDEQDRDRTLEAIDVHPLEVLLEILVLALVLMVLIRTSSNTITGTKIMTAQAPWTRLRDSDDDR